MAAQNPRVHVVLERSLYRAVATLAKKSGTSLSLTARDLIKEAVDQYEDLGLGWIAEERRRRKGRLLTHEEMLRRLRLK
jgi:hypothetical protein